MDDKSALGDWPAARAVNQANWDERVPIHAASGYDLPAFVAGKDHLQDFEIAEVGDVAGKTLVHLQCHMGMDALSWARRGATVAGLDFSAPAIEQARSLAGQIGVRDATFVVADVYDAVEALGGRTFDVVYTGIGALCWLPDIVRWARTAAALVAPGGFLYLAEFHPLTDSLGDDGLTLTTDYFKREPSIWDEGLTYADPDARLEASVTVGWQHPLGEVVTALIDAGLRLEWLHEHDFTLFRRFPNLVDGEGGLRFPAGHPSIPLMYSLRASKPV